MKEKKLEPSRFRKRFWTWHGCITPVGFTSLAQGFRLIALTLDFSATMVATCCSPRREPGDLV